MYKYKTPEYVDITYRRLENIDGKETRRRREEKEKMPRNSQKEK